MDTRTHNRTGWSCVIHDRVGGWSYIQTILLSFDAPLRDICGWSMQTLGSKGNSAYGSEHLHKENLSTQLDSIPSSSVNCSKEVEALYRGIHMILS